MARGRTSGLLLLVLGIGAAAAAVGCGDDRNGAGTGDDALGTITFDLSVAPVNARCAVVTITPQGGMAIVRQIPLGPSQAPSFVLGGLPTGTATVSEQVFTVACSATTGQTPMWASDTVTVALSPAAPVSVTFNLTVVGGSSQLAVINNFPNQAPVFNAFPSLGAASVQIAPGPDGALWVTNFGTITRITTSGVQTTFPLPGGNNDFPFGIVTGPDGNLWFTNRAGTVGRITTSGQVTEFTVPGTNTEPLQITLGTDANLWFTAASAIGQLHFH